MRLTRLLFLTSFLFVAGRVRTATLREVLREHGVPTSTFTAAELNAQLPSVEVSTSVSNVLIAYSTLEKEATNTSPLHLVTYHRSSRKLTHRVIRTAVTSDECSGAVMGISEQDENILIETHINPSAECTILLDSQLHVRKTLFAWVVAKLGPHDVLMEEDEIHFAPVHPLRLAVFNLPSGKMQEVYPPDGDPLRARFSSELSHHLPSKAWCAEHNHPCDPGSFDEDLRDPAYADASGTRVAFIVTFSAEGFGDDAARSIGLRSAMYVYRREEDGWSYCQQEIAGDEVEKRQAQLHSDFESATESCSAATKVTVARVDSPFSNR